MDETVNQSLRRAATSPLKCVLYALRQTGARPGEICQLTWEVEVLEDLLPGWLAGREPWRFEIYAGRLLEFLQVCDVEPYHAAEFEVRDEFF